MKKRKLIPIVVLIGGLFLSCGPKAEDYAALTTPRIVEKPDTPALIAEFDGEGLEDVLGPSFKAVYGAYYGLKGVPKGKNAPAPVARYEDFDTVLNAVTGEEETVIHWKGYVALPLPSGNYSLNDPNKVDGYPVRIDTLKYGTVAEIVHFGSYDSEQPTIDALKDYIEAQGYRISGLHEEEYIKGPGFLPGNPDKYITIIRYQVEILQ